MASTYPLPTLRDLTNTILMNETVVCVGAVVTRAEKVLLVRQSPGHSLEVLWTIPWGQIEGGESPSAAVLREVSEEAGVAAHIEGLLGIQELPDPWKGMLGIVFLCAHADGEPVPDSHETDAADFFDLDRLESIADSLEPLTSWLVRRVLIGDFVLTRMNHAGPFTPSPTYL